MADLNLARRLASTLRDGARQLKPPVSVEEAARSLGAEIRYEPFDGALSGMAYRDGAHLIIGVNSRHSRKRQRFTIAHELGHLMMHQDAALHIDARFPVGLRGPQSSLATDRKEVEANQFAAELLMPAIWIREELAGVELDVEDDSFVRTLAKRYDVSTQAMTVRLTTLDR